MQGELFVHEMTEVRPGTALEYLDAVREERVPLLADYDHHLVGLYEVLMNDYEVCTIWATSPDGHVRAGKARDEARGARAAGAASTPTHGSRRGTPGRASGRSTGARSS